MNHVILPEKTTGVDSVLFLLLFLKIKIPINWIKVINYLQA